jgi:hypothetical protein
MLTSAVSCGGGPPPGPSGRVKRLKRASRTCSTARSCDFTAPNTQGPNLRFRGHGDIQTRLCCAGQRVLACSSPTSAACPLVGPHSLPRCITRKQESRGLTGECVTKGHTARQRNPPSMHRLPSPKAANDKYANGAKHVCRARGLMHTLGNSPNLVPALASHHGPWPLAEPRITPWARHRPWWPQTTQS